MGTIALGATNKMFWSEMHQGAMELALDIHGAEAMLIDSGPESGSWPGARRDKRREGYPVSPMMSAFFFSRSETIWGGTSQIQRNIVGERVLGLPKEPKPPDGRLTGPPANDPPAPTTSCVSLVPIPRMLTEAPQAGQRGWAIGWSEAVGVAHCTM